MRAHKRNGCPSLHVPCSQPFRGWGHSWPGHFLPTDRVAHWSLREVPGKPLVASQEFKRVVPRVQPVSRGGGRGVER